PAPVRLYGFEDQPPLLAVLEGLRQHRCIAVDARDIEACFGQPDRVKPGSAGDIENLVLAARFQHVDEELAFAFRARIPVDQFVPLLDEAFYIFGAVVAGLAHAERIVAIKLVAGGEFLIAAVHGRLESGVGHIRLLSYAQRETGPQSRNLLCRHATHTSLSCRPALLVTPARTGFLARAQNPEEAPDEWWRRQWPWPEYLPSRC